MAISFSPATIVRSGGPYMHVTFDIILDGSATTASDLSLPAGFPNLQAQMPASSGAPMAYSGAGPVSPVVYMNALGGTATGVTATRLIAGTSPASQLTLTVSGAGTSGQTVKILALVPDTF